MDKQQRLSWNQGCFSKAIVTNDQLLVLFDTNLITLWYELHLLNLSQTCSQWLHRIYCTVGLHTQISYNISHWKVKLITLIIPFRKGLGNMTKSLRHWKWPSNSPDPNPIEHLQDVMEKRPPTTQTQMIHYQCPGVRLLQDPQGSPVHVLTGQICFGRRTCTNQAVGFNVVADGCLEK